jgi:hypothetical protein
MPRQAELPSVGVASIVAGIVVILVVGVLVQLIYSAWPLFLALAVGLCVAWWFLWSPWGKDRQYREEIEALYREAQALSRNVNFPDPDDISKSVLREVSEKLDGLNPPFAGLAHFWELPQTLYRMENLSVDEVPAPPQTNDKVVLARYRDQLSRRIAQLKEQDVVALFCDTIAESITSFLSALPASCLSTDAEMDAIAEDRLPPPPFSLGIGEMLRHPGQAVEEMVLPFYAPKLRDLGLFTALRDQLQRNLDDADNVMPKDNAAGAAEIVPTYLSGTPLETLFEARVPFALPPKARFEHQWIVGGTGTGKTTFISAMLMDDLARVAAGEASVFVMDSQNELIPSLANLKIFAPGQPLHGKLVYLEPDPDYPLALNIFDVDKERMAALSSRDRALLESGAMWMVQFFLSSLVKAESSPHQDIFLNYTIPALMAIPNATIFDFKNLLEPAKVKGGPTGYDRYRQHFGKLRPDAQQWLAERMHSTELAVTRNAIRARLDGFTSRGLFHDMFSHPRNKLDLFTELQSSKVILVNTMKGFLKSDTEAFGRYFIARLLQAMEERMFVSKGERLPVFAYIDEATDYIAEEENVAELIDKARKQNVALILAHQRLEQIRSANVLDALRSVAIQCQGTKPPLFNIALSGAEPVPVHVTNVRFDQFPHMTKPEYEGLMAQMRERYAVPREQASIEVAQAEEPPVTEAERTEVAQDY